MPAARRAIPSAAPGNAPGPAAHVRCRHAMPGKPTSDLKSTKSSRVVSRAYSEILEVCKQD
jgi:hypothetical protein